MARATSSPAVSRMAASSTYSRFSLLCGGAVVHSASSVPRAFFLYSMERLVMIARASSGIPAIIARPLVTSARFINAMACTDCRWLRTAGRSCMRTRA